MPFESWFGSWKRVGLAYLAVAYVLCFHGLGSVGLLGMEGIVVAGARHMIDTGDWIVPHLYGEAYTYKPALAYWLSALTVGSAGDDAGAWVIRAPFALCAVSLGGFVLVLIGRHVGKRAGLICGIAAIGTPLFLEKVRLAEFDIPLSAAVGVAVTSACVNLALVRPRTGLWLVSYGALGLGFLAKGVPALMAFAPGLLLAAVLLRRTTALFSLRHLSGGLLFAGIAGAYLILVKAHAGLDGFSQPLQEAGARGLDWNRAALLRTLVKPLMILGAFLPWSLLLPRAARLFPEPSATGRIALAAGGFLAGGMATFVAVPTHEMRYYLPLSTSLALCTGLAAHRLTGETAPRGKLPRLITLAALLAALGGWALHVTRPVGSTGTLLVATVALLAVLTWSRRPSGARVVTCLVAVALFVAVVQVSVVMPRRADRRVLAAAADRLDRHLPPEATLWVQGPADPASKHASLYFYLRRPVRTFRISDPPPDGSFVLFVDDQRQLYADWSTERIARYRQARYTYELARVSIDPPPPLRATLSPEL